MHASSPATLGYAYKDHYSLQSPCQDIKRHRRYTEYLYSIIRDAVKRWLSISVIRQGLNYGVPNESNDNPNRHDKRLPSEDYPPCGQTCFVESVGGSVLTTLPIPV